MIKILYKYMYNTEHQYSHCQWYWSELLLRCHCVEKKETKPIIYQAKKKEIQTDRQCEIEMQRVGERGKFVVSIWMRVQMFCGLCEHLGMNEWRKKLKTKKYNHIHFYIYTRARTSKLNETMWAIRTHNKTTVIIIICSEAICWIFVKFNFQ